MIVAKNSGFKTSKYIVRFGNVIKDKIELITENTDKFRYEKGYFCNFKRKISKDLTIRFDDCLIDLSQIEGIKEI